MASETIKVLLMIALFGVLEAALYAPRAGNPGILKHLRRLRLSWPHRPAHTAIALVPVRMRHLQRKCWASDALMPPGLSA
jgi:hypothetical protein